MINAGIAGTGSYLPQRIVSNDELALTMDTSDDWIVSRTGIQARHVAAEGEMTSDLAEHAARRAMAAAHCSVEEVDLIIVATTTPDMVFPSTACLLQHKLGIKSAAAFDVQAVCTGFIYALSTANALLKTGQHKCALVVGAEVFSRLLDWNDRRTSVLFGDGAGAVILRPCDQDAGIIAARTHADGSQGHILRVAAGISGGEIHGHPFLEMDGQAVFKLAVRALGESAKDILQANEMGVDALDWYIPHQANLRILKALCERIGISQDKLIKTVAQHGNTSAASVPLALDTAVQQGLIQNGQLLLLQGVGGGMTWGSVLLRWCVE